MIQFLSTQFYAFWPRRVGMAVAMDSGRVSKRSLYLIPRILTDLEASKMTAWLSSCSRKAGSGFPFVRLRVFSSGNFSAAYLLAGVCTI